MDCSYSEITTSGIMDNNL